MKIATVIAVLALSLSPTFALAEGGCMYGAKTKVTASSCAEGAAFDASKGACVPLTTS